MPPHDGVRLDDELGGAPLPPRLGEQDPEESVPRAERWTRARAPQCGHLLTEREILERDGPVAGEQDVQEWNGRDLCAVCEGQLDERGLVTL